MDDYKQMEIVVEETRAPSTSGRAASDAGNTTTEQKSERRPRSWRRASMSRLIGGGAAASGKGGGANEDGASKATPINNNNDSKINDDKIPKRRRSSFLGMLNKGNNNNNKGRRGSRGSRTSVGSSGDVDSSNESSSTDTRQGKTSITISDILAVKHLLEALYEFCRSRLSLENLMFWIVVESFRRVHSEELASKLGMQVDQVSLHEQTRHIYHKYMRENADQWVCNTSKVLRHVNTILVSHGVVTAQEAASASGKPFEVKEGQEIGPLDCTVFDLAQADVRRDLEEDIIPCFVRKVLSPQHRAEFNPAVVSAVERLLGISNTEVPAKSSWRGMSITNLMRS